MASTFYERQRRMNQNLRALRNGGVKKWSFKFQRLIAVHFFSLVGGDISILELFA